MSSRSRDAVDAYWSNRIPVGAETTTLSAHERGAYRVALAHIPGVSGFRILAPDITGKDVIEALASVSDILGDALREKSRIEDELRALRSDVDAARRIFGNTLTTDIRPTTVKQPHNYLEV